MSKESNQSLIAYLKKNISKGYTIESLQWALISQGYSRIEVSRAIEQFNRELAQKAPILKEKPAITYEVFDHDNKPVEVAKKSWLKRIFGL